jgi:Elongation factor G C-terminus
MRSDERVRGRDPSALSRVLSRLHAAGAALGQPDVNARRCRVTGVMPTDQVQGFEQLLAGLTQGEGFLLSVPAGYEPVLGPPPTRDVRGAGTGAPGRT